MQITTCWHLTPPEDSGRPCRSCVFEWPPAPPTPPPGAGSLLLYPASTDWGCQVKRLHCPASPVPTGTVEMDPGGQRTPSHKEMQLLGANALASFPPPVTASAEVVMNSWPLSLLIIREISHCHLPVKSRSHHKYFKNSMGTTYPKILPIDLPTYPRKDALSSVSNCPNIYIL